MDFKLTVKFCESSSAICIACRRAILDGSDSTELLVTNGDDDSANRLEADTRTDVKSGVQSHDDSTQGDCVSGAMTVVVSTAQLGTRFSNNVSLVNDGVAVIMTVSVAQAKFG